MNTVHERIDALLAWGYAYAALLVVLGLGLGYGPVAGLAGLGCAALGALAVAPRRRRLRPPAASPATSAAPSAPAAPSGALRPPAASPATSAAPSAPAAPSAALRPAYYGWPQWVLPATRADTTPRRALMMTRTDAALLRDALEMEMDAWDEWDGELPIEPAVVSTLTQAVDSCRLFAVHFTQQQLKLCIASLQSMGEFLSNENVDVNRLVQRLEGLA